MKNFNVLNDLNGKLVNGIRRELYISEQENVSNKER